MHPGPLSPLLPSLETSARLSEKPGEAHYKALRKRLHYAMLASRPPEGEPSPCGSARRVKKSLLRVYPMEGVTAILQSRRLQGVQRWRT